MSGHSKWNTIKHKKGIQDQRRGVLFTKLTREIMVAVRSGDPDPELNFRLRLATENAKSHNMPKENIERAVTRAKGTSDTNSFQEITYEAYSPGGAGLIIQALTDNKNRAVAAIRTKIVRAGGSMSSNGSVSWNFTPKGRITVNAGERDEEEVAMDVVEEGAEDVDVNGKVIEAIVSYNEFASMRKSIENIDGVSIERAELTMEPNSLTMLNRIDAKNTLRLLDELEELDDVQRVFSNADFPENVLVEYAE